MISRLVTIVDPTGLHARPAASFVKVANGFVSSITIRRTDGVGQAVNAKSIADVLSLGIAPGKQVEISACGEDEKQAVEGLVSLIASGFEE